MVESPLISIIMPAHNAAKFIAEAIQSVLDQTYSHWELIIVDDASTDDTARIIAEYADPRIRYFPVQRIGSPSGVRNVGFNQAQGELIAFLDADDVYYPHTLSNLIGPLMADPSLNAVHGFAYVIDEEGRPMQQHVLLDHHADPFDPLPDYLNVTWEKVVTGKISCLLPSLLMRRSVLDTVGYFDESLCGPEDFQYYARIYLYNFNGIKSLPIYAYRYRVYTASLTKDPARYEKVLNSVVKVADWIFNEAGFAPEMQEYRSRTYVECYRHLARERLINTQPQLARQIALKCLKNPNVKVRDWLKACMPIVARSFLPSSFDALIVKLKWEVKSGLYQWQQLFRQTGKNPVREEFS